LDRLKLAVLLLPTTTSGEATTDDDDDDADDDEVEDDDEDDDDEDVFAAEILFVDVMDTDADEPQLIECLFKSDMRENVLQHLRHLYFLTSLWVCMWARKLDRSAKARAHTSHLNGFSPVWVRT
jgi:hypothetical protein